MDNEQLLRLEAMKLATSLIVADKSYYDVLTLTHKLTMYLLNGKEEQKA